MKEEPRALMTTSKFNSKGAWAGMSLAALFCVTVLMWPKGQISAGPIAHTDSDGDGLCDAQEQVLNTHGNSVDTDGDGYSDAEELARHSSPLRAISTPMPSTIDLALSARGDSSRLVIVFAAYLGTRQHSDVQFSMGALLGGRVSNIPPWYFMREAWMATSPGFEPGTSNLVVEMSFPPHVVHVLGDVSFFGVIEDANTGAALAADVVDIGSTNGVIFMRAASAMQRSFQQVGGGGSPLAGSVYLPIPPGGDGDIPMSWTPGQVCYQKTQIVGAGGGVVTHEVVEAECRDGWDAYCKTDCSGSVGSTYDTMDPSVLVGG